MTRDGRDGRRRSIGSWRRATALLAAVVLAGCTSAGTTPSANGGGEIELAASKTARSALSAADAKSGGAAVNAFGFDVYGRSARGNLVLSPASIAIALSMARAGAAGETASQMDAVMHDLGSDPHAGWVSSLDQSLAKVAGAYKNSYGNDIPIALRIANAPFSQRGMTLQPAYLDALSSRFGAGLRLVDYRTKPEAARLLINGWVNDATEKRIPELLAPGIVTSDTRLVLVNAIYLEAGWQEPFMQEVTKPAPFTTLDGTKTDVPTMHKTAGLRYAAGTGWTAVELPYVGDRLAMTLILPDDLAAFDAGLDAQRFDEIVGRLAPREVQLSMPRFKLETKTDLAEVLGALGMPLAFSASKADFSAITKDEQLFISAVVHQANIDVDEKGTTAAAATAVAMAGAGLAAEPVEMALDRPFVFALRDRETGAVLFLGRVADPRS